MTAFSNDYSFKGERMIEELNRENSRVGLNVNKPRLKKKTLPRPAKEPEFQISNQTLESLREHAYIVLQKTSGFTRVKGINQRTRSGCWACSSPFQLVTSNLPLPLKRQMYNSCISQCWHKGTVYFQTKHTLLKRNSAFSNNPPHLYRDPITLLSDTNDL